MTDKEYEAEKNRIRKLAKKWIRPLGLGFWKIDIEYEREDYYEGESDEGRKIIDKDVIACCSADPNYLQATLTFYIRKTKDRTDDELEEDFLHELMHVFVSPMSHKDKRDGEERTATTLARAFLFAVRDIKKHVSKV